MKKILLILLMFFVGMILFMPKINLYYTLEAFAKKEHVEIKEVSLRDRWVDLHIEDAVISYDGIPSVLVEDTKITPWLLTNSITATNVRPSKELESMFTFSADTVALDYKIWDYKHINIHAEGNFGVLSGYVDVIEERAHFLLEPSATFKHHDVVKTYFKKTEEGLVYESKL